jgi:hypothetical protein
LNVEIGNLAFEVQSPLEMIEQRVFAVRVGICFIYEIGHVLNYYKNIFILVLQLFYAKINLHSNSRITLTCGPMNI